MAKITQKIAKKATGKAKQVAKDAAKNAGNAVVGGVRSKLETKIIAGPGADPTCNGCKKPIDGKTKHNKPKCSRAAAEGMLSIDEHPL